MSLPILLVGLFSGYIGLFLCLLGVSFFFKKNVLGGMKYIAIGIPLLIMTAILCATSRLGVDEFGGKLSNCRDNLRQFGHALNAYTNDNEGRRPNSFQQVTNYLEKGIIVRGIRFEKSGAKASEAGSLNPMQVSLDYILVTNVTPDSAPLDVQAYCIPEHHKGTCCNVLCADGRVETVRKQNFRRLSCDVEKHSRVNTSKHQQSYRGGERP